MAHIAVQSLQQKNYPCRILSNQHETQTNNQHEENHPSTTPQNHIIFSTLSMGSPSLSALPPFQCYHVLSSDVKNLLPFMFSVINSLHCIRYFKVKHNSTSLNLHYLLQESLLTSKGQNFNMA